MFIININTINNTIPDDEMTSYTSLFSYDDF